jgi:centromere protein C
VVQVRLPPHAVKEDESTHNCTQLFHVAACQPRSVEAVIGTSHYLLSPGDQFFVPFGTVYSLVNHSPTVTADLGFVVIRPQAEPEDGMPHAGDGGAAS